VTLEAISENCAISIRNLQSGNNVMVIPSVPQRSNVDNSGEVGEGEGGEGEGEGGDAKDGEGQGERTDGPGNTRELVAESIMEAAAITSAKAPAPPATILSMRVADFDDAILGILMTECGADCETWPCE
jgi:hypothetical protein